MTGDYKLYYFYGREDHLLQHIRSDITLLGLSFNQVFQNTLRLSDSDRYLQFTWSIQYEAMQYEANTL